MDKLYNPVSKFYKNYNFNTSLPIILFNNYNDLLKRAKEVKTSCILLNTNKNVIETNVNIDLSYSDNLNVVLVLNIEMVKKSTMVLRGKNYSISNITFNGGDKNYKFPTHLI